MNTLLMLLLLLLLRMQTKSTNEKHVREKFWRHLSCRRRLVEILRF